MLGRHPPEGGAASRIAAFTLMHPSLTDEHLVRDAIRLAAVYAVHNRSRHLHPPPSAVAAREMLPQALHEAVRGHRIATRMVSTTWIPQAVGDEAATGS